MFSLSLFVALPSVLAIGFSCITWNSLSRPWLFVVSSTLLLNVSYALAALFYGPGTSGLFLEYQDSASRTEDKSLLSPDAIFMILFSVVAILLLLGAWRIFRKAA